MKEEKLNNIKKVRKDIRKHNIKMISKTIENNKGPKILINKNFTRALKENSDHTLTYTEKFPKMNKLLIQNAYMEASQNENENTKLPNLEVVVA